MFVGDKNENINFKKKTCQCDDAIPGSFARAVGNLGTRGGWTAGRKASWVLSA